MNFGGHKSSHHIHQWGMRFSVISCPYQQLGLFLGFLISVILVVCRTHCYFNVPIFSSFQTKKSTGLCELSQSCIWEGQGHHCIPIVTNHCAISISYLPYQPFRKIVPLCRVQECVDGSAQNFHHSLQNDLPLMDERSSHIVGIKEELWKRRTLGRGWWFQLSQDNTKEGNLVSGRFWKNWIKRRKHLWHEWQLLLWRRGAR